MSPRDALGRSAFAFAAMSFWLFASLSEEFVGRGLDPAFFFRSSTYFVTRASKSFTISASSPLAAAASGTPIATPKIAMQKMATGTRRSWVACLVVIGTRT